MFPYHGSRLTPIVKGHASLTGTLKEFMRKFLRQQRFCTLAGNECHTSLVIFCTAFFFVEGMGSAVDPQSNFQTWLTRRPTKPFSRNLSNLPLGVSEKDKTLNPLSTDQVS